MWPIVTTSSHFEPIESIISREPAVGLERCRHGAPGQAAGLRPLYYRHLDTPLGPMLAMASADGVVLLEFLDRPILVDELRELRTRYGFTPLPGEPGQVLPVGGLAVLAAALCGSAVLVGAPRSNPPFLPPPFFAFALPLYPPIPAAGSCVEIAELPGN